MDSHLATPERRRAPRGLPSGEPHRRALIQRVLGTYAEMPGLRLTRSQAEKQFGVSGGTVVVVLDYLVDRGALARDERGQYFMPSAM